MNEKEAKIAKETALADKLASEFAARQQSRTESLKSIKVVPLEIKSLAQTPTIEQILAARPPVSATSIATPKAAGPFVATSDKAYFHSTPNASSRRDAYIVRGQGGTFTKVENNFGYLTFTYNGKTTVGWIQISDVRAS